MSKSCKIILRKTAQDIWDIYIYSFNDGFTSHYRTMPDPGGLKTSLYQLFWSSTRHEWSQVILPPTFSLLTYSRKRLWEQIDRLVREGEIS